MTTDPNNAALWRELNQWIKDRTGWIDTDDKARELWSAFLNGHALIIICDGHYCGIGVYKINCGLNE